MKGFVKTLILIGQFAGRAASASLRVFVHVRYYCIHEIRVCARYGGRCPPRASILLPTVIFVSFAPASAIADKSMTLKIAHISLL